MVGYDDKENKILRDGVIDDAVRRRLNIKSVSYYAQQEKDLQNIGLWAIPPLLPYPMTRITRLVEEDKEGEAIKIFKEFCNKEFIKKLVTKWETIVPFYQRKKIFEEALFSHENGHYHTSIHTLSPQIEGTITDYLNLQFSEISHKAKNKIKKFLDSISEEEEKEKVSYVFRNLVESLTRVFVNRPPQC